MRLGVSPYLSARIYVHGLKRLGQPFYTASPARLADMLRRGELDAALTSSSEYFNADYCLIKGQAISCKGPGADAVLFANQPLEKIRTIALDETSRTTNLLVQVVMHLRRRGQAVQYVVRPQDTCRSLKEHDACLLIGDRALTGCGDAKFQYDITALWQEHYQQPVVLTVWLAQAEVDPAVAELVAQAFAVGQQELETVIQEARLFTGLAEERLRSYYADSLDFDWREEHEDSLRQMGEQLAKYALVRGMRQLCYLPTPSSQST